MFGLLKVSIVDVGFRGIYELALNIRPTEISGFIGNHQLPLLKESINLRKNNYISFRNVISEKNDYYDIYNSRLSLVSNMAFPVLAKTRESFIKAKNVFEEAGVEIRPIVAGNMINQPFFKKLFPNNDLKLYPFHFIYYFEVTARGNLSCNV